MPIRWWMIAVVSWLCLSSASLAQQEPATEVALPTAASGQEARVDDVVVHGRRLEEAAAAFVEDIAAPPITRGLARWNRPVCLAVVNMRRDVAERLLQALTRTAVEYGIELQEPGCEPDVLIIATDDGPRFATRLVAETRRRHFRPGVGAARIGQPLSVLEHFRTSDAAVRWWQTSLPTDSESGTVMVRLPGRPIPEIEINSVSQMRARIRDDLKRILIVVDVDAASSATLAQLEAYLAMIAFAQIDAMSDKRDHSTILNLFEGGPAPPGLTDWDRGYLQSLYDAGRGRIRAFERASSLADVLMRTSMWQAAGDETDCPRLAR